MAYKSRKYLIQNGKKKKIAGFVTNEIEKVFCLCHILYFTEFIRFQILVFLVLLFYR